MKPSKGTPRSLKEAVANGLAECGLLFPPDEFETVTRIILNHVKDRLAQDFAVSILKHDDELGLKDLYIQLFPHSKAAEKLKEVA